MEQEIIEDYKSLFGNYDETSPMFAKNMNDLGEKYGDGEDGFEVDYQKAIYCIQISSKLDYPDAIHNMGLLYYYGMGLEKSREKAYMFFQEALKKGYNEALNSLADFYMEIEDYKKAFYYSEKAADKGLSNGYLNLSKMYLEGLGVKKDYQKALYYAEKAADDEWSDGFIFLCSIYLYGLGVEKDSKKAFNILKKGVSKGRDDLLSDVGYFIYYGVGTNPNKNEALKCFQKAADLNDEGVTYLKNYAYINGEMTNYESMFLNCPDDEVSTSPYYVNIKKMLEAGAKVHSYQSIVDLSLEELDKLNPDDIVNIRYNNNLYGFANIGDCHRVSDMKKILLTCQKLLSDIDLNQPEEDIFMQIYIKLGLLLHYDESDCSSAYNMRTLLKKNGVCLGIAISLKALLDMVHIESNIVFTGYRPNVNHAFLQVKINAKWYYCDLTGDLDSIKNETIDYCLLSEESIQTPDGLYQVFNLTDKHEALEDYPDVLNLFRRNYKKIKKDNNSSMQEHRMSI